MISGFTVNKPPVYGLQGLRDEHKIKFAKEYIVYARKQDTMSVSGGVSISTVTMGACMTQEALAHHARFDFHGRPIRDIHEHEWEAMFEAALKIPAQNKAMVIARLRGIAMDEKLLRVGDRMTEWQSAYLKILVAEGAEDIDYFHPKPVIQALMAGIRPAGVKALVKEAYDFNNKAIKGNIAAFWEFVRSKLEQVLPAMEAAENASKVKALNKRRGDIRGGDEESKGTPPAGGLNKAGIKRLELDTSADGKQIKELKTAGDRSERPPLACWACKGPHHMKECTHSTEAQRKKILEDRRIEWDAKKGDRKSGGRKIKSLKGHKLPQGTLPGVLNDLDPSNPVPILLDSGSDCAAVISRGLAERLAKRQDGSKILKATKPQPMEGFGSVPMVFSRYITIKSAGIKLPGGPITLINLPAWIDETDDGSTVTLGRIVMETLGYDLKGILKSARAKRIIWDMSEIAVLDSTAPTSIQKALKTWYRGTQDEPDPYVDEDDDVDEPIDPKADPTVVVKDMLTDAVRTAVQNGLPEPLSRELHDMLLAAIDVFRIKPAKDPPIKTAPLVVTLRPGATPVRCTARRYNPLYTAFLNHTVADWLDLGLAVMNPDAHWASAPRIVPKKNGELRMTVDMRGVNAETLPLVWPMPILDVVMARLSGMEAFFICDWFRGFWQLGLHPDCREWFSITAINQVVTPTRVQMGQTDAVAYCQRVAQEVYGERYGNGLEGWVDDVLGSARSPQELMSLLKYLLQRCLDFGLKLHPGKCTFYATEVVWCGRRISAAGVGHDPKRIAGLIELSVPTTRDQL
jgi:hypothetical protein